MPHHVIPSGMYLDQMLLTFIFLCPDKYATYSSVLFCLYILK